MTLEWLNQLYKLADIVMSVPTHLDCWGLENFEPLVFYFFLMIGHVISEGLKRCSVVRKLCAVFQNMDLDTMDFSV